MFSGIIEAKGTIISLVKHKSMLQLCIETPWNDLCVGESIAVDGVCLSVTSRSGLCFTCDVSPETLAVTIAAMYQVGVKVNLERSLQFNQRVWGHLVAGHIDTTLVVSGQQWVDQCLLLSLSGLDCEGQRQIVKKGSIAVQGVSLTINHVSEDGLELMLIPETLRCTTLGNLQVNDQVNVEYDQMVKMVSRQVALIREQVS